MGNPNSKNEKGKGTYYQEPFMRISIKNLFLHPYPQKPKNNWWICDKLEWHKMKSNKTLGEERIPLLMLLHLLYQHLSPDSCNHRTSLLPHHSYKIIKPIERFRHQRPTEGREIEMECTSEGSREGRQRLRQVRSCGGKQWVLERMMKSSWWVSG
jgi:hypothetical protein